MTTCEMNKVGNITKGRGYDMLKEIIGVAVSVLIGPVAWTLWILWGSHEGYVPPGYAGKMAWSSGLGQHIKIVRYRNRQSWDVIPCTRYGEEICGARTLRCFMPIDAFEWIDIPEQKKKKGEWI